MAFNIEYSFEAETEHAAHVERNEAVREAHPRHGIMEVES
jgi:hypothetical protein